MYYVCRIITLKAAYLYNVCGLLRLWALLHWRVLQGHKHILMGGDFNFCLDPILDKSSTSISKTKSAQLL